MAKSVFGADWEEQLQRAHDAFVECAKIQAEARQIMEQTSDTGVTSAALDKMSAAATEAHKIWVAANPIRWARTHRTPPYSVPVLAPLVGLSTPALFQWEHGGVSNPDAAPMEKISEVLHEPHMNELWRRWRDIPKEAGYSKS